jgi:DNA-binding helix-hairpin-helix protein with protein kinase domain
MAANPPIDPISAHKHSSIAWPLDLLRTAGQRPRTVGFLMPRVSEMQRIIDFFNPKTRREKCPLFNYFYLHRTARNLVTAVRALHERGYVIGDVNESNILVSNRALVTLVDTDSFQVWDGEKGLVYRCRVGKPEYTPPELQGKSFAQLDRQPVHDLFGLGVILFQLLMEGTHPFAGTYTKSADPPPYEKRIAAGHFPHAKVPGLPYQPSPTSPAFECLHPILQHLFVRCFQDGHLNPVLRPDTQAWQWGLEEAENALATCWVNDQHLYGSHLTACPWCERTKLLGGRDPFPSLETVKKGEHLQPAPRRKRSFFPPRNPFQGKTPPLPPAIPSSAPSRRPRPRPHGRSSGVPWHTLGWPRAKNYWAWLGLSLSSGSFIEMWFSSWPLHRSVFTLAWLGILGGIAGEFRSKSWDLQGRGKRIARAAIGLGLLATLFYLIAFIL